MTAGLRARIAVDRGAFRLDAEVEVAPGETLAVMGPSGAGKSTLVGALAGLVPLSAGEIAVGDRVVERTDRPRRRVPVPDRGIVMLGQDARLFPHLSVRENVAFGMRARGVERGVARQDAEEWLERVGVTGRGGARPAELSGGQQQRVAVARALAASPAVVLLDEPLVALDPETAGELRAMLRAALADTTVVAVTHDAVDAAGLADRLAILDDGRFTQTGPVREVFEAPATRFAATLAGLNRLDGVTRDGWWERSGIRLRLAPPSVRPQPDGAAAVVFRPSDVRIAVMTGSATPAPDAWSATVDAVESLPGAVRLRCGAVAVDVTPAESAGIPLGARVSLSVSPDALRVLPSATR